MVKAMLGKALEVSIQLVSPASGDDCKSILGHHADLGVFPFN